MVAHAKASNVVCRSADMALAAVVSNVNCSMSQSWNNIIVSEPLHVLKQLKSFCGLEGCGSYA